MQLLITGGTGFIGTALLVRLLDDEQYTQIKLLVRSNERQSANQRVVALLERILPKEKVAAARKRVSAVSGDLTKANLGINSEEYQKLASETNQVMHIGASTDFGAPLEESRLYNVEGTRRIIELATTAHHRGALRRFDYISTAFVAGIKSGKVSEHDLERGQKFANNYEQTKYEAEVLVRSAAEDIPTTIYRPSIVVGDSRSGYTPHFKVLYWPIKLLAKQVLPFVPCNLSAKLDIVPIDYVANSIRALMGRDWAIGETYYLTAGEDRRVPMKRVFAAAIKYAGVKSVPVIPVWIFTALRYSPIRYLVSRDIWATTELAAPYHYYLKGTGVVFDSTASEQALAKLGIMTPDWRLYHQAVMRFCKESRWGRRLSAPIHSYLAGTS